MVYEAALANPIFTSDKIILNKVNNLPKVRQLFHQQNKIWTWTVWFQRLHLLWQIMLPTPPLLSEPKLFLFKPHPKDHELWWWEVHLNIVLLSILFQCSCLLNVTLPCGSVIFTLILLLAGFLHSSSCVNRHQCWFLRTGTRYSLSLGLQSPAWCLHKVDRCAGSVCWVDFNGMMFLLLGLGLTQYFSEALTWFWESSLLIKYSGEWLSRDLLIYVFKPHVPLPTELAFLAVKWKGNTLMSHSALLVTKAFVHQSCPVTVWRLLQSHGFCGVLASFLTCSLIPVIHFTSWRLPFPLC